MARKRYDLIIEAVRYLPSGEVEWVRGYKRRGSTYSDWVLLSRQALLELVKMGKKVYTGKRIPYLASTFEIRNPVILIQKEGKELLQSGNDTVSLDSLGDVPVL